MDFGIVRAFLEEKIRLFLRHLEVAGCNQQLGYLDAGLVTFRLQFNSSDEFLVSRGPLLSFKVALRQLVVGIGVILVDLNRVGVLDRSFTVLAFLEVALAAVKIFLLAQVGILRACRKDTRNQD